MRALPFGMWAGVTMPDDANYAPDYGPQPARSYTRARQHLQITQPTPNAYIGVHTAFALLPWGDLTAGAPERWLFVVTAVGRHVDTDGAEMHAGEAYLLSWDAAAAARWQPSSLPRKVAHQYYYDWGRQQGTHPHSEAVPSWGDISLGSVGANGEELHPQPHQHAAPQLQGWGDRRAATPDTAASSSTKPRSAPLTSARPGPPVPHAAP